MGSESLKDQEKRDLFFSGKREKTLWRTNKICFSPRFYRERKSLSNFQTDKLFLPSSEEKTV